MTKTTEQYYTYRLAQELMSNDMYELLYLDGNKDELWLSKNKRNKTTIIRLIQKGFDWKNHLKADITSLFQRISNIQRRRLRSTIEIFNIYVTDEEPIDTWQQLKRPIVFDGRQNMKMHVFYVTGNNYNDERNRFIDLTESQIERESMIPSDAEQADFIKRYKYTLQKKLYDTNKRLKEIFTYGKPTLTYGLLAINIVIFLLLEMAGGSTKVENLVYYGAKYNPAILDGEWWRIITSMFLHVGAFHLFMNMVALYYLGTFVERVYGSGRFFIIYFLGGIGGSLTSFAFNMNVAAGASGALFGLFGALLYFGLVHKQLFLQTMGRSLLIILSINIVLGFAIPQIDMGAHLGGLLMGFIASFITALPNQRSIVYRLIFAIIYVVAATFLVYYGMEQNIQFFNFN